MINLAVIELKDIIKYLIKLTIVIVVAVALTKYFSGLKTTLNMDKNAFLTCFDTVIPSIKVANKKDEKIADADNIKPLKLALGVELSVIDSLEENANNNTNNTAQASEDENQNNVQNENVTQDSNAENGDASNDEVKEAERKTLMNTIKWKEQDEYIACIMTIPSFWQVQNKLNTITVYEIEEMMPCKAFLYDDQVVFLLNKTHLISQMGKEYTPVRYLEEKLQMIAKNCGGSIGYSDSFREMGKLSIYYRQAVLAAAYASSSGRGILPYHHVSVPHLLREAEQAVSRDLFLHPAVRVLEEYDSANHTEFLKTLYIYLKNERRTTETVKELYIHRNSLLYRLERIREITGFQLEDYRERLRMLLSCEIYFGQQYL